jgi:16S rRNA processing protein RimM
MIRIAKIINTHALKGECRLWLYTDSPDERFMKGAQFELEDGTQLKLKSFRMQKGFGYAFFEGVDSIEKAEKLKGHLLTMPEDELPPCKEGEFYYHQLQGCSVYNTNGQRLGQVSELLETGANLVLRVKGEDQTFLVPFVDAFVKEVHPDKKEIVIEEMDGLR